MDLVYAVASLSLAAVLSVLVLLGSRMPDEPVWASEGLMANVWCVAITGLIGFGAGFGIRFFVNIDRQVVGLKEITLVAAISAACYLIIRRMALRRRLAEYAAQLAQRNNVSESSTAEIVTLVSHAGNSRSPSKPTFPKAA